MNLKPPITRADRSGWLGRGSTRLKSLVVIGAMTLGFAGFGIAAAIPASADPAFQFIQGGSDTTEYVMDAFADALGNNIIGEYDATDPVTNLANGVITPQLENPTTAGAYTSCSFNRPNGSGSGFQNLDMSYNPSQTIFSLPNPPQPGCYNISRSSSPPGSVKSGSCDNPGSLCATGNFVYIPFAVDVVTYATGPTAATTAAYSFTATMASPAVFTATGSSYVANNTVELTGTGLPGGFSTGTLYYVENPSGTTFNLASSFNGTPINSTSAGSGTVQFESTTLCTPGLDTSDPRVTSACALVNGADVTTYTSPGTSITQGLNLTVADLQTLYENCQPLTVGSTTLNPGQSFGFSATSGSPESFSAPTETGLANGSEVTLGTAPTGFTAGTPYFVVGLTGTTFNLAATSGGTAINGTSSVSGNLETIGNVDLYAPQAGSGTLAFWELEMGGLSAPASCWHQTIVAGPAIGVAVEEHDGTAFYSDPNGIGPISAGRWVAAQAGNDPDLRHGDVLQDITPAGVTVTSTSGVSPLNAAGTAINVAGCLASGVVQATCFPVTRELYNIMDYYEVVNVTPASGITGNPAYNPELAALFSTGTSAMCESTFQIKAQGFQPIASTSNFPDLCGATTSDLRVQMNNSSTNG